MLPLRDANPALTTPWVTGAVIVISVLVFFRFQPRQPADAEEFFYRSATIPCEVTTGEPLSVDEILGGECARSDETSAFPDKNVWWSLIASIFYHGDIAHLLGNLWVLWIFGNNVEDAYGRSGYLIFYLFTGLAASLGHVLLNPTSTVPVVGASGAIAGVMGAYLILFPGARVVSMVPPFFFWPFVVPAGVFLVIWLAGQFLLAGAATNIAWEAHVVGFLAGLGITLIRRPTLRRRISTHQYQAWGRRR